MPDKICSKIFCEVIHFGQCGSDKALANKRHGGKQRIAEQIVQSANLGPGLRRFRFVRFGNVLGSSGSVLPLFHEQIMKGGPIELTHSDITRYFMSLNEAAELIVRTSMMESRMKLFIGHGTTH